MSAQKLETLLKNNESWAQKMVEDNPDFFNNLCDVQSPKYLWIGCADSRVPANVIVDLQPGEMFVHRNIANVVPHTDMNCLSVIQYAVQVLKVEHIIVTGHYNCGGVKAAMSHKDHGPIENWLTHIKDVYRENYEDLMAMPDEAGRFDRLCELNVLAQARNVALTTIVQNAWKSGQNLQVHGWIYRLKDGLLKDLGTTYQDNSQLEEAYQIKG